MSDFTTIIIGLAIAMNGIAVLLLSRRVEKLEAQRRLWDIYHS